ncbi:MAG: hypothetical protein WAT67_02530 [Candidatus Contendobacter sp.]
MRTTLDIDEEVLMAAKELAYRRRVPIGRIVSGLLRQALTGQGMAAPAGGIERDDPASALGFQPFPAKGLVTNVQVNALREEEGL